MNGNFQRSEIHQDDVLRELRPWVMGVVVQYLARVGSIKDYPRTKADQDLINNIHSHCFEAAWRYIHDGIGPGGNCSDLACDIALRAGKIFGKFKKEPEGPSISPPAMTPEQYFYSEYFTLRRLAKGRD